MQAACLASGPSLTAADVELVRQWRSESQDRIVIVTNTTYRLAPWADWCFAMDRKWWELHLKEAKATFKGELISNTAYAKQYGITHTNEVCKRFEPFQNSGAAAVSLACRLEAERVVMLGYDGGITKGKSHWHGDHPKPLGNCGSQRRWHIQFQKLRDAFPKAEILNASRHTTLRMFPTVRLEDALGLTAMQEAA